MKSLHTGAYHTLSVLLLLILLFSVTLPSHALRTPLQKWLGAVWMEQHAHPLHWFMDQHARVPNTTTRFRLAAQTAGVMPSGGDGDAGEHRPSGRYVVARLSQLTRAGRRHARRLLADHSAETHVIDDAHTLLFLDAAASPRLRARAAAAPLAAVSVLDVYAARLKLSRALRGPLRHCPPARARAGGAGAGGAGAGGARAGGAGAGGAGAGGAGAGGARAGGAGAGGAGAGGAGAGGARAGGGRRGVVVLDVRTAAGHEAFAAAALRRAAPPAECRWSILAQRSGSGLVRVELGGDTVGTVLCRCRAVIDAVAEHTAVRWVEPAVTFADPQNYHASALVQSGVQKDEDHPLRPLWDAGINGSGEIVGMADSGMDFDSCFFDDPAESVALFPKTNARHRKIISYYPFDIFPEKYYVGDRAGGHGTHVAGTAVGHVSGAESHHDGVAKGAKLFFRSLTYAEEIQLVMPDDITQVFHPGYTVGARVFSNSWGFRIPREYTGLDKILDLYTSAQWDAVLLFAAGNAPNAGVLAPCRGKNMLCIGSHENSFNPERRDFISSFESHGPTYDGRIKPEIVAPGQPVVSAYSDHNLSSRQCTTTSKSGTSMAAATVAGSVALLRQHLRTLEGHATPSAALVKALLIHSTMSLKNPEVSGFGRLDLSVFFTPTGVKGWWRDNETIPHRGTNVYCFTSGSETTPEADFVKVTLAWTDVGSALEGSLLALVNDLDLVVVDAAGVVHLAHGVKRDNVNVIEQIKLAPSPDLAAGFRVFVYGENVHDVGLQNYALVVSAPNLQYHANCNSGSRTNDNGENKNTNKNNRPFPSFAMCAGNCSGTQGGGVCRNGQCICAAGRRFVDCSLCDEERLCNGHGTCTSDKSGCVCDNENFADSTCRTCKPGWYGPSCSSTCLCSGRGKCVDKTAGQCVCERDTTIGGSGCFDGPNCEFCCRGFTGPKCNERSYWCDEKRSTIQVREPNAYIQINGYGKYAYYFTCLWEIEAPAEHTIKIEYLNFDVDPSDDALMVFDKQKDEDKPMRTDKGVVPAGTTFVSSSNTMSLFFLSRWGRVRHGFLLRYTFVPPAPVDCNETCATGAACDSFARGFCLCAPGRAGWQCERTVSSSSSSSSSSTGVVASSQILRELQVMRLPLRVNERGAVAPLHLRPPPGTDAHLFFTLPPALFAVPQRSTLALLFNVTATRADGTHARVSNYIILESTCTFVHLVVGAALRSSEKDDMRVYATLLHSAVAPGAGAGAGAGAGTGTGAGTGAGTVAGAVQVAYQEASASRDLAVFCGGRAPAGALPVYFGVVRSRGHGAADANADAPRELRRDRGVYVETAVLALVAGLAIGVGAAVCRGTHRPERGEAIVESESDMEEIFSSLHTLPPLGEKGKWGGMKNHKAEYAYKHMAKDIGSDLERDYANNDEVSNDVESQEARKNQSSALVDKDVEIAISEDALK